MDHEGNETLSHENGEGDEMQTDKGFSQAFVVAGETTILTSLLKHGYDLEQ
jgi:hypothetical protein